MKTCNRCKAELPATADYFHKRSASKDGLSYTCIPCSRMVSKTHYGEKADEYKERARVWARAHPERRREIVQKSADKHAEQRRLRMRRYAYERYHQDLEQARLLGRLNAVRFRSRPENKAKIAEWDRRWRRNNPERMRVNGVRSQQVRRARLRNALVEYVDRDVVFSRDEGVCHVCCAPVDSSEISLDHVIPLARGGEHSYANVRLAHNSCNKRKGIRLLTEIRGILAR